MHGDAVHADLNGVPCRTISRTVGEVQLNGLDWVNGRSERRKGLFKGSLEISTLPLRMCHCWLTDPTYQRVGWTHLGWRSRMFATTGYGTWWRGMSCLSRTSGTLGLWACTQEARRSMIMLASLLSLNLSLCSVLISISEAKRCEQTLGGTADGKIRTMWPPSRVGEEVSCTRGRYHCEEVHLHNAEYLYYP